MATDDIETLVSRGLETGLLTIVNKFGICCDVAHGQDWFYFGGEEADSFDGDGEQYVREVGEGNVIEMIADVLRDGEGNGLADDEDVWILDLLRNNPR